MNARCAPGAILGDHAKDEGPQFLVHAFSSHTLATAGEPGPIELEPSAMPTNDRLGLNDEERLLPARPEFAEGNPKQPIWSGKSRLWMPMCQDFELLPQGKVFQEEIAAGAKEAQRKSREKYQQTDHTSVVPRTGYFLLVNMLKMA